MNSVSINDFSASGNGSCPASAITGMTKINQTAVVNLNRSGCAHGNQLSVSLDMGLVTDAAGNAGSGTVQGTYTLDTVGPAGPVAFPAGGIALLFPTAVILTFDADVDMSSVTVDDFSVTFGGLCGGASVTGFSKTGHEVTIAITSACVLGAINLNIRMTDIKDTTGNVGVGTPSIGWLRVL